MCEFVSWIEKDGKCYFLTAADLASKRGKQLIKHCKNDDDLVGHGAIRWFYGEFTGGTERECTDFASPDNFPREIVAALIAGKFRSMGSPLGMLNDIARAKYKEIEQPARVKYEEIEQPAWAKYKEIKQTARAKYEEIKQTAWAKYEEIEQPARAKYKEIEQTAWAKYKEIEQPAWAKYKEIEQTALWDLITQAASRSRAWQ